MEKIKKYYIWISLISGFGYQTYSYIKNVLKMNSLVEVLEYLWNTDEKSIEKKLSKINKKLLEKIKCPDNKVMAENVLSSINKNNVYGKQVKLICVDDVEYSYNLTQIYNPPLVLYGIGDTTLLNKYGISIVGCRDASEYGKKVAYKFAREIASLGIVVISGMAKGIDTYSHLGCLSINGKTIAVLGCGVDVIYPSENKKLYTDIINNGGLIISEYCTGTSPMKQNFPARNRIISGISNRILIVEAKEKSGSLITVDFGLEQGKEIYAIPSNINSINGLGTNNLIKDGAKLVTSISDIIEDIAFLN